MAHRLISTYGSEIHSFSATELKESIRNSEGRTILSQNFVGLEPLVENTINPEIAPAFGADMIFLNGYSMDKNRNLPGLHVNVIQPDGSVEAKDLRINDVKKMVGIPVGVYLECGEANDESTSTEVGTTLIREDRIASKENIKKAVSEGADFIVLGGNPGTGTSIDTIIKTTKMAKDIVKDKAMVWSGKWEDGTNDKVLGDPLRDDNQDKIAELIDAGADVVCLSMPGYRQGINLSTIRDLITFVHKYSKGNTLAMSFLDGSVEGSDTATVRECALMSKQTGADIHAIGDAGLHGISVPEDIYQLAMTIKGRRLTWLRMGTNRR